jgi:hypothetical protein
MSTCSTHLPLPTADNVADKSNAVNQKLSKRREHIEELHKVQQLLRKLQVSYAQENQAPSTGSVIPSTLRP